MRGAVGQVGVELVRASSTSAMSPPRLKVRPAIDVGMVSTPVRGIIAWPSQRCIGPSPPGIMGPHGIREEGAGAGRALAAWARRRRWLRRLLIVAGIGSLLVGTGVAVAALWAFTILPRSLPSVTALETFQPLVGHQDLRRQRRADHRAPRRAADLRAPRPHPPGAARRDHRHRGPALLLPLGRRPDRHRPRRRTRTTGAGGIVEGGSTITQQLTKVLFLTPDKSLERKLKEAVLALELERRYSKDRILEMYLNQVYFGHGAYGVEAAARTYFGKSVSELNVREAALLAGLPRAPTTYSPFEHGEAAKRRREVVLAPDGGRSARSRTPTPSGWRARISA